MLELYHNHISTCSQKVRLVLAEKGLEFESHIVDLISGAQHDPDYVKLNPNHVVPTLVHDGRVIIESSLINEYLDDAFPQTPMKSANPGERHALRTWVKRIDEKVHTAAPVVTFAIGPRKIIQNQPEEVREAAIAGIPDANKRAARRSVIEHGVKAPEFAGALSQFLDLLDDMEAALEPGTWLSGPDFGLADAAALPYVLRLEHCAMTPLLDAAVRPNLADWYARVKARPAYKSAVDEWAPAPVVELFRSAGEEAWADVEPLTRR